MFPDRAVADGVVHHLKPVGRFPRTLSAALCVLLWGLTMALFFTRGPLWPDLFLVVPPAALLLLSLRVKAWATSTELGRV